LAAGRHPDADARDPLYRAQPERWLEAGLRRQMAGLFPAWRADCLYSQVPALPAGRALADLLTVTREGRLVVIELRADEDLHLPLEALDYWMRVQELLAAGPGAPSPGGQKAGGNAEEGTGGGNAAGEARPGQPAAVGENLRTEEGAFERSGYFPGLTLSRRPPLLVLIAPALRLHPANEVVLRYLSPRIEWEIVAIGEQWRRQIEVVERRRPDRAGLAG
jgi:hypothetical protein